MWINDKEHNGYNPYREHDTTVPPEFRVEHGLRVVKQELPKSYVERDDFGDTSCWFYWDFESEVFVEVEGAPESDNGAPPSRKVEPSDYMREDAPANPMPPLPQRRVGSWNQGCLAARQGGDNLRPIRSKVGASDLTFKPKTLKSTGFETHRDEVKTVVSYHPP